VVSAIVMVGVSYMTAEPDYNSIRSLTFGTTTAEDKQKTSASWSMKEVLASALVLGCIIGGYLYFQG
jgi:SSS family solute:Na+ symporter